MARRQATTLKGRRFLRGPRIDIHRRGPRQKWYPPEIERVFVGGHWLNIPESIIYRALQDLGLNFQAQASTGGGRTLGGALVDFLLLDYRIALEYQGPFHDTDMGRVQDFWRVVSRQQAGLRTVYIYQEDLRRIKDRLLEIIGRLA